MSGINQVIGASPKMKEGYDRRLRRVAREFRKLGRGSKTRCAFDMRISPTTVSTIVNGKRRSLSTLATIETWINMETAAPSAPPSREVSNAVDRS